jgi:hypothetical protein
VSPSSKDTEHSLNTLRHACIMDGQGDRSAGGSQGTRPGRPQRERERERESESSDEYAGVVHGVHGASVVGGLACVLVIYK